MGSQVSCAPLAGLICTVSVSGPGAPQQSLGTREGSVEAFVGNARLARIEDVGTIGRNLDVTIVNACEQSIAKIGVCASSSFDVLAYETCVNAASIVFHIDNLKCSGLRAMGPKFGDPQGIHYTNVGALIELGPRLGDPLGIHDRNGGTLRGCSIVFHSHDFQRLDNLDIGLRLVISEVIGSSLSRSITFDNTDQSNEVDVNDFHRINVCVLLISHVGISSRANSSFCLPNVFVFY